MSIGHVNSVVFRTKHFISIWPQKKKRKKKRKKKEDKNWPSVVLNTVLVTEQRQQQVSLREGNKEVDDNV